MRIAINTLSVSDDNEGIRTLVAGLVPALVRADPAHRYRLICSLANRDLFAQLAGQVDMVVLREKKRRPLVRIVHDQITVPWLVRRGTDLLLTPSSVGSVLAPVPQVVVLVAHLALPSVQRETPGAGLSIGHRLYYGPLMRLSHRRAAAVVAISQFLADRLVHDLSVPAAKVHAIPCGVDPLPSADGPGIAAARMGHGYLLFVGTLYPYKNPDAVVRAMAEARTRLPAGFQAVVAGRDPDGTQVTKLRRLAQDLGVGESVVLPGRVADAELVRLYQGATAMVFPSRAEGFGLPPLEAMARGIPVIASDRTAMPEVVGDAGLLVDPDRPRQLADAIVSVVEDGALRQRLAEAGRRRAGELSWDAAARAYTQLFSRLAG